jgi:galactokinase
VNASGAPGATPEALARARAGFAAAFGTPPAHVGVAPGRVNLIGEHIDYCGGPVLPIAIDRCCAAAVGGRGAGRGAGPAHATVRVVQVDTGEEMHLPASLDAPDHEPPWGPYVRGVLACVREAASAGWGEAWRTRGAFDLAIAGDVPLGAGLSSSASLEVSVAMAALAWCGVRLEPLRVALLCQRAEREFAGVPCGIMDQSASVFGRGGQAMLLDCAALERGDASGVEFVPAPDAAACALLVVNTGVRHALADGAYAQRREACARAAAALGVARLCDAPDGATPADVDDWAPRAARHVLSERARVRDAVGALRARDWPALGVAMRASHESLRNDYAVSCAELDAVVEAACAHPATWGARLTGAGFGGSAIVLARREGAADVAKAVTDAFAARFGRACEIIEVRASDGARVEPGVLARSA